MNKTVKIFTVCLSIMIMFSFTSNLSLPALAQETNSTEAPDADTKGKDEDYGKLAVKLKAWQVNRQIAQYLLDFPQKTLVDLQDDRVFRNIAVQKVGETGYTAVLDSETGYFYFHPQDKLVNSNPQDLEDNLPDWRMILEKTIGSECREADGNYWWKEIDGSLTEKYMYSSCVDGKTADGKSLFVAATSYLDEIMAVKYLSEYNLGGYFLLAREAIKQKAQDIAKQIDIFLRSHPGMTVKDLQADDYFNKIAVQPVGKTGYTAIYDAQSMYDLFHPNPKIVNIDLESLKDELPEFWQIIEQTKGGFPNEGLYKWKEADGQIKDKYMSIAITDELTADQVRMAVAATTLIDDYAPVEEISREPVTMPAEKAIDSARREAVAEKIPENLTIIYITVIVLSLVIVLFLYHFQLIRFKSKYLMVGLSLAIILVLLIFALNTYFTNRQIESGAIDQYVDLQQMTFNLYTAKLVSYFSAFENELEIMAHEAENLSITGRETEDLLNGTYTRNKKLIYASYRIDADGIIKNMYPIDDAVIGADVSGQDHMVKIKATLEPVISDVFMAVEGFNAIAIHYPIIIRGRYDGTVAFLVNLENLFDYLQEPETDKNSGLSMLVDSRKTVIYASQADFGGLSLAEAPLTEEQLALLDKMTLSTLAKDKINVGKKDIIIIKDFSLLDNIWHYISIAEQTSVLSEKTGKIWLFSLGVIISVILLAIIYNEFLTRSLKSEVRRKTSEIEEKKGQIEEQLKAEEKNSFRIKQMAQKEIKVKEELEEKIKMLERFQALTVDRELKMIELKNKLHESKNKDGRAK